ncbi:MAG: hypothetical protein A3H98_12955 [Bacteroidetes bacterium RIFCSPLOWO2_02_FULL_36_8]|nr:MAG: hypothetical protein A3H98_12955 [Bacteroidetes bacterium RIFCSPLOWO2_02_FULL_36_8]OFY69624.1 MAG: hypothetical protein A3G23_13905 [Bacteroidetes bacterium RIFCSPLOWO2_12_FULL_37_12]
MQNAILPSTRKFLIIFTWLLVITLIEIGMAYIPLSKTLLTTVYLLFTLLKVFLIAAYFMHLKHDRINFILTISLPIIFIFALLFVFLMERF